MQERVLKTEYFDKILFFKNIVQKDFLLFYFFEVFLLDPMTPFSSQKKPLTVDGMSLQIWVTSLGNAQKHRNWWKRIVIILIDFIWNIKLSPLIVFIKGGRSSLFQNVQKEKMPECLNYFNILDKSLKTHTKYLKGYVALATS